MARKTYVILVASQKGGVGKTTIAINLATALRYQKYEVLLIDADSATNSVSDHLGVSAVEQGYQDALNGDVEVKDVLFAYQPLNLHLLLGNLADTSPPPTPEKINKFYNQVFKLGYDFVVIDSAPGFFPEALAKFVDDVAIITTPDSPSTRSSAKLSNYCDKYKLRHRMVINRLGFSKYDLDKEEVEKAFGDVASMTIPEDRIVQESVAKHKPAYMIDRNSSFSLAIEELSRLYTLRAGEPSQDGKGPSPDRQEKDSFFKKLGSWTIGSK